MKVLINARSSAPTVAATKVIKKAAPKPSGTQTIGTKKVTSIGVFTAEKGFRQKQIDFKPAPRLLARVEQLKLLSKLESAGLLSVLEKSGITLSFIEKTGLLSTAESLGVLSAAAERQTPSLLYTVAIALFAAGVGCVYLTPDTSSGLVALQLATVAATAVGGGAAFAAASLLETLQKESS